MKTFIELTIASQFLLSFYFIYIIRSGHWAEAMFTIRATVHFVIFCLLVANINTMHLNPYLLVAYFAITLEELLNVRVLDVIGDRFWPSNTGGAEISFPTIDNTFTRYSIGMKIDVLGATRMVINLFTTGSLFRKEDADPVCAAVGRDMSLAEILLHPGNYGHEALRMLALGLLIFL